MFGLGLSLTLVDFRNVVIYPRSLIIGLISQMLILPAFAFVLATQSRLEPELKIGLVIIAACPGGATSNLITYLLRGNVALSISITLVNSLLTLFSIPFFVYVALFWFMGLGQTINMPLGLTILKVFYITLLPISLGIFVRFRKKDIAERLEKKLRVILPVIYGFIFIIAILGSRQEHPSDLSSFYFKIIPFVLALNVVPMAAGFLMARLLRVPVGDQVSLAVEIGIQNSALAITIAGSSLFLNNYVMAIPAVVYGLVTFSTSFLFGWGIKRFSH